jgi:hypothetical protein
MGFSSCFLRFLPLLPLAALVAEWATCFAFGSVDNDALQLAGSDGLSVAGGANKEEKNRESRRSCWLC